VPAPVVHFLTRKPLVNNARVFKQAASLSGAGYDVLLVGVRRGGLPERERRDGIPIVRVGHDPLPRRLSQWARRDGGSPTTVRELGTPPSGGGGRARRAVMRAARAAGTLPWLLQSAAFYARAYRLLRGAVPAPAVVHVTDLNALLPGVLLARRHGVPLVYDAQELYTGIHTLPPRYRALLGLQERLLLRHVDRLVAVNPAIADAMRERYGRAADAVVLNCPPYRDAAPEGDIRARLGLPAGAPVLVYSGGLLPARGIEQTLLALHHLPGAVLVALGEGELRPELEALADREGLRDRVRFHGFVSPEEVPGFIASADVGVVPYRDVGLNHRLCSPSKLFHYLMAGLPVACSDLPFLRAVALGDGVGTVFDPGSPAAIAEAVSSILAAPEPYRARVAAVRERYSWEHEERRFLGVYATLPSSARPPASPRPAPPSAAPSPRPS